MIITHFSIVFWVITCAVWRFFVDALNEDVSRLLREECVYYKDITNFTHYLYISAGVFIFSVYFLESRLLKLRETE